MRVTRLTFLALLLATTFLLSGCVVIDGQRLSWFYDRAKDELAILLHYDGVHDSGDDKYGNAAAQLPEFVRDGDIMILGWPFHTKMAELRKTAEDPNASPFDRATARHVASIQVETIGYYREPDGRMGAAQLITIPQAAKFITKTNEFISQGILQEIAKTTPEEMERGPLPATLRRIEAAARAGHQWIRLDGQSVRIVVPVQPDEWTIAKSRVLLQLAHDVAGNMRQRPEETARDISQTLNLLAMCPLSYIDRGDEIEVVIGRPKVPSIVRAPGEKGYKPNLEQVLIETAKIDLDRQLAEALLDEQAEATGAVAALIKFGPPEEQARALMRALEAGDEARKKTIADRLNRWATEWNRDHVVPKAPTELGPDGDLDAWKTWYDTMRHCVKPAKKPEQPEKK